MTENESWELIGTLAVEMSGWDEHNIEATRVRIQNWASQPDGLAAVTEVINTYSSPGKPPFAVLQGAYNASRRRTAMNAPPPPALPPGGTVTFAQGRAIAARSYALECSRRDPLTDVEILAGRRKNEANAVRLEQILRGGFA
jgi:hypothetical protein